MKEMKMKRLNTWEKKILRRICGPMVDQGIWRIRTNQELRELHKDLDIVTDILKNKKIGMDRTSRKNGPWKGS
jgi:hypothetical protein